MAMCVVENVPTYDVTGKNTKVQAFYKKRAFNPSVFNMGKAKLASSYGVTKLKPSHRVQRKCLAAEELFDQMRMNDMNENEDYETQDLFGFLRGFTRRVRPNTQIRVPVATKSNTNTQGTDLEDTIEAGQPTKQPAELAMGKRAKRPNHSVKYKIVLCEICHLPKPFRHNNKTIHLKRAKK